MLRDFLLRWLANGVGLFIAAHLIPGVKYEGSLWVIVVAALVFSIVNALVRPVIVLLSLPAIVFTMGFFTLIINALMLYLVTLIYPSFQIATFPRTILAVIIIWLVNYVLSTFTQKEYE